MAKTKKSKRIRPTIAEVEQLSIRIEDLKSENSALRRRIDDARELSRKEYSKGEKAAESIIEAKGLLADVFTEINQRPSHLGNRIAAFLGFPTTPVPMNPIEEALAPKAVDGEVQAPY